MTRVYGNKVTNTNSGGSTRTWRVYGDYSTSSTETAYTIKGTSLGVQNTASSSATTMGFNANSLTASYSGAISASYKRTTKTGEINGGATFEVYGTDKSAVIERTRVSQTTSLTFKVVANSNTVWDGTSTKTVSFTIPARTSHTVSYNANGGSGSIASFTKFYSAAGETAYYETLSDGSGFSKTGYRITGWNTMPDGSGTSYPLSGAYAANGTTAVTLYAQWQTTFVKPEIQNLLACRTVDASGGATPTVSSLGKTGFCKFNLVGGANFTVSSVSVQFGTATAKSMTKSGTSYYGYSTVGSIARESAYTVKITVVVKGTDGISRTYTDSTYISKSVPVWDAADDGNCFAFFGVAEDGATSKKLIVNGALTLGTALAIASGGTGATTAAAARTNLGVPSIDKIKNMFCTAYTESLTVTAGTFTDNGCTAALVGNCLRLYLSAKAKAAITAGNITNQTMLTITFIDSKIASIYSVSGTGATSGPNSQMLYSASSSGGQHTITVTLAAIAQAVASGGIINAFVAMPCTLNWDAY